MFLIIANLSDVYRNTISKTIVILVATFQLGQNFPVHVGL